MATATIRPTDVFSQLPIEQLMPSVHNPRKHFDADRLEELAQSIRENGIVEPLVVRKRPVNDVDGAATFEIIAGERRYRAAMLADQAAVPAIIRTYTDEQVAEIVLIENLQRQDLTPLEQAAGFKALQASNPEKHTLSTIASRVGMSDAWVWDRLKLNDLVADAKQLLAAERITIGHGILLSRLKAEDQQRAIDPRHPGLRFGGGLWRRESYSLYADDESAKGTKDKYAGLMPVSVRELDGWIKSHVRFDVEHAAKAQPLVFAGTAQQVTAAAAEAGRGRKVISITHDHRVADAAKDDSERTYGRESWVRADGQEKSKTCEHSVLGVVVAGAGYGTTLQVCIAREKCRTHFGAVIKAREKAAKLREQGDTKKAGKVEKKAEETWQQRQKREREEAERERAAWDKLRPVVFAAIADAIPERPLTNADLRKVIDEMSQYDGGIKDIEAVLGGEVTGKTFTKALALVDVLGNLYNRRSTTEVAKKHGVDIKAIEKAQAKAAGAAAAETPAKPAKKTGRKS